MWFCRKKFAAPYPLIIDQQVQCSKLYISSLFSSSCTLKARFFFMKQRKKIISCVGCVHHVSNQCGEDDANLWSFFQALVQPVKLLCVSFRREHHGEKEEGDREKEKEIWGQRITHSSLHLPNFQHVCIRKSSKIGEATT